jgi:hypothetical protein
MNPNIARHCRVAAAISIALWSVSLFLPAYVTALGGDPKHSYFHHGYDMLLLGWYGPLEWDRKFAWYANPFFLWSVWRMSAGRAPNAVGAFIGIALALTALHPFHIEFGDDHGVNGESLPRSGAYVWAAAFVPAVLVAAVSLASTLAAKIQGT